MGAALKRLASFVYRASHAGRGLQSTNGINNSNRLIGHLDPGPVWVRTSTDRKYVDVEFDWDGNWIDRWEYHRKYRKCMISLQCMI